MAGLRHDRRGGLGVALPVAAAAAGVALVAAALAATPLGLPLDALGRPRGWAVLPARHRFRLAAGGGQPQRGQQVRRRIIDLGKAAEEVAGSVGSLFGGAPPKVPLNAKEVVEAIKASSEVALNQGHGCLAVEMPSGYDFGIEGGGQGRGFLNIRKRARKGPEVERTDRELARVFVEMLQPISSGLFVLFGNKEIASYTRSIWKLRKQDEYAGVLALPSMRKSQRELAEQARARRYAEKLFIKGSQCLIIVSPKPSQLRFLDNMMEVIGDDMGVMLLNAGLYGRARKQEKLGLETRRSLQKIFEPSLHLHVVPKGSVAFSDKKEDEDDFVLISRKYEAESSPWVLSRLNKAGGLEEVITEFDNDPSVEEVKAAMQALGT